ncbi:hypothetical protein CR513_37441, partial [Mucuna pruriens]
MSSKDFVMQIGYETMMSSGYVFTLRGGAFSWKSTKQKLHSKVHNGVRIHSSLGCKSISIMVKRSNG